MSAAGALLARLHRSLLVVGTAFLAVAASRLAIDLDSWGPWILAIGAALLMIISDLLRDIDEASRALAGSSGKNLKSARLDVFESQASPRAVLVFLTSLGLIVLGLIFLAPN